MRETKEATPERFVCVETNQGTRLRPHGNLAATLSLVTGGDCSLDPETIGPELVRRWNAHADLVEAVELLLEGNGGDNGCAWCGGYVECEKSCSSHKARLALAKAKGGGR